mmetsp:Transcript_38951/g.120377  ORF Transcript_38951/g.120377 Transcript_38951/m.120377 type:complete len:512 (+) Transcript_38951:571-2106(+)
MPLSSLCFASSMTANVCDRRVSPGSAYVSFCPRASSSFAPGMRASISSCADFSCAASHTRTMSSKPLPNLCFRWPSEPSTRISPSTMMATRCASASTSSRWCVVSTTAHCFTMRWIAVHRPRRATGSMPALGSSRNTTRGPPMRAMATESLRFWPPERADDGKSRFGVRSTASSISSASAVASGPLGMPFRRAKNSRCSTHVISSHRMLCCGQKPMCCRAAGRSRSTLSPYTTQSPPSSPSMPIMQPIVVVLPAPLWPSSTVTSSWYIGRSRPFTATKSPNTLRILRISTDGSSSRADWGSKSEPLSLSPSWASGTACISRSRCSRSSFLPRFMHQRIGSMMQKSGWRRVPHCDGITWSRYSAMNRYRKMSIPSITRYVIAGTSSRPLFRLAAVRPSVTSYEKSRRAHAPKATGDSSDSGTITPAGASELSAKLGTAMTKKSAGAMSAAVRLRLNTVEKMNEMPMVEMLNSRNRKKMTPKSALGSIVTALTMAMSSELAIAWTRYVRNHDA